MMLMDCEKDVNAEEQYDNAMRSAYGAQWNIIESNGLNPPYRQNI
jgi:hypothetical protein